MKKNPADDQRAVYLEICEDLLQRVQAMRNYGMKPGNAWLAKAELGKISGSISRLESMLDELKRADEQPSD